MKAAWYARRLLAMSPAEIIGRTRRASRLFAWKRGWGVPRAGRPCATLRQNTMPVPAVERENDFFETALIAEAQAALRGEWRFFGCNGVREDPIDWSRDPLSGTRAPQRFSFSIDHRNYALVGDVKYTWEKNRLHEATILAAGYTLTGDARFAAKVRERLDAWIIANPVLRGINWTHPLEAAIRTISFVWSERLLRGSTHHDFFTAAPFLSSLDDHLWFINQNYSIGSSANNHRIGEAAGVFIGTSAIEPMRSNQRRRERAKAILEREIVRQTFPDGINREMGFDYHLLTAEFFLLALYEARLRGDDFSRRYIGILRSMVKAIERLRDAAGNLPTWGDGDDGRALLLDARATDRTLWIAALGRHLTEAKVGPPTAAPRPVTLRLLGIAAAEPTAPRTSVAADHDAFPDAGCYLMRKAPGQKMEVFVIADAGPLGFGALAAHAHADALSFTMSIGGIPIFVDPGTFTYYGDAAQRTFFRSTAAHNTVRIAALDQSIQSGLFLWGKKAATTVERWEQEKGTWRLAARHDGYRAAGVVHRRVFTLSTNYFRIDDALEGGGEHIVELFFHCSPACTATRIDTTTTLVECKNRSVMVRLPPSLAVTVERGGEFGWYSPRFGIKEPSPVIRAAARLSVPVSFTTTIELSQE
jgi:hypothetical protein